MAVDQQIFVEGTTPIPKTWEVPPTIEASLLCVNAVFDGSGASGQFYPTVEIVSDGGLIVARCPCFTAVAPGGSAEVSWFRLRNQTTEPVPGSPYEQVILARPTVRLYWKLDEIGGTTAHDSTGNGYDGEFSSTGMSIQQPALADGYSFAFSNSGFFGPIWDGGPRSLVNIQGAGIPMTNGNDVSVEMWVKTTQPGGDTPYLFNSGNNSAFAGPFVFLQMVAGGLPRWIVYDSGGAAHNLTGVTVINDGVRHQLGGTFDGATMNLYVDGALDATAAAAFNIYPVAGGGAGAISVNGRRSADGIWANGYTGHIDEVSYYTGVLTAADYAASWAARN